MVSQSRKNKKRNFRKDIFFSILFGVFLVLIVGFLITTNIKISRRRAELANRIAILKQEIGILEEKRGELEEKISQAGSEEYLEKVARDQLDMKAPGEEVVVIVTKEDEKEKEEEEKEKRGWWEWIKSKF